MMWVIVCLGVIIAAFAMWDSIHDELPEELRLPRSAETFSSVAPAPGSNPAVTIDGSHWAVSVDARNMRVSRSFIDGIVSGGIQYYPPVFHLSCYNGGLFAWISTGLQTETASEKPGYAVVRINGGPVEYWQQAESTVIIAPSPMRLVNLLLNRPELTAELTFEEAPKQTLRLRTNGIADLSSRLTGCKASSAQ